MNLYRSVNPNIIGLHVIYKEALQKDIQNIYCCCQSFVEVSTGLHVVYIEALQKDIQNIYCCC
jgi:hypothetical protein